MTDSLLRGEILEQPAVIARLLEREYPNAQHIAQAAAKRDIHYITIAARGSSDNAAL